jgi:DNA-directed RNA polymerase specialized sigma24 family protein
MVLAWIGRHPDFAAIGAGEDADHWVDAVFVRFWNALKPERFGQFGETRQLLAYLKMCASSVVQDELRQRQQRLVSVPLEPVGDENAPEDYSRAIEVHDPPEAGLEIQELLGVIRRELRDDLERQVFELSIRLGFTPREITRHDPEHFPTAAVVYQVKRNLLERLRRSPDVRKYLAAAGGALIESRRIRQVRASDGRDGLHPTGGGDSG